MRPSAPRLAALLSLVAVLGSAVPAWAAGVSVAAHQAQRLTLRGSAADVVIGDPSVADVALVGPRTLMVIGKAMGTTSLVVYDRNQQVIFEGPVSVSAPAGAVAMVRGGGDGAAAQEKTFTCYGVCAPTGR